MITEMNQRMAERLLLKESALSYKKMRRSIENYESIKRTMNNNRRVVTHGPQDTLPGLSVSLKRSRITDCRKSRARLAQPHESTRSATIDVAVGAGVNPEAAVGGGCE